MVVTKESKNVLTPPPLNYITRALARGAISLMLVGSLFIFPPPLPPELYSEYFSTRFD